MDKLKNTIRNFIEDEEGLTVVEYVIGAALLVAGLTAIFTNLGSTLDAKLSSTIAKIS
ncbi:Flp family type IVb pilin [Vibrio breoganii]|uniref:Fimbrial protein n=1 Tax=Vibrio breoganii TaxID=553239 RepID=A0AAP8SWV1_9VIBR|nr:Flp family type IVb pilin [Vibrio breoganii]NMO73296.1 Flp family type IVb pilin [Vibrio breoganii]NMR69685.1 Flp family type IVb pilin [Vibrio breoganii]PML90915.1 fimbrial protein [Vibrio breoganii]PMP10315.1 fimbrial protein [Vibrio breoganii]